ncbi:MAG: hypothetical protein M3162_00020, partial [Thermoproteota archaeon]|nr:hypothetical protein [Thermoproteota archaeon]
MTENNSNGHGDINIDNTDSSRVSNQQDIAKSSRISLEITVVGRDKKGIVAEITKYIFENGGNIEKINQNVIKGLFGMHLESSFPIIDNFKVKRDLDDLSKKLGMEIKVHFHEENKIKNIAIFVSKEEHCLLK